MVKKLVVLAFVLPTVVLCCVIVFRIITRGLPDTRSLKEIRLQYATNQMALWNTNQYVTITNTEDFERTLDSALSIKSSVELTPDQKIKLQRAIFRFLIAYHDGDYETYKEFRMPLAGEIDPKHLGVIRSYVAKKINQSMDKVSLIPQDELFRQFVAFRSEGKFYKDYFEFVSMNGEIKVDRFESEPLDLKTLVFHDTTNLGVASYAPMFIFDRSPSKILQQDGALICATVMLYVKTAEPGGNTMPGPVYLRLVWDIQSQKWLPSELVAGNIWQKSKVIMVF